MTSIIKLADKSWLIPNFKKLGPKRNLSENLKFRKVIRTKPSGPRFFVIHIIFFADVKNAYFEFFFSSTASLVGEISQSLALNDRKLISKTHINISQNRENI